MSGVLAILPRAVSAPYTRIGLVSALRQPGKSFASIDVNLRLKTDIDLQIFCWLMLILATCVTCL